MNNNDKIIFALIFLGFFAIILGFYYIVGTSNLPDWVKFALLK